MRNLNSDKIRNEVRIVDFSETIPLFITASAIGKAILGLSPKTLANWRSYGRGPKYYLKNGSVYYKFEDLEKFFGENPVEAGGEGGSDA
jgi:hypothetical protein